MSQQSSMDAEPFDCHPIAVPAMAEPKRSDGPQMTPARRAALEALERELGEFLKVSGQR